MWELPKLILELQSLRSVLEHLSIFEQRAKDSQDQFHLFGTPTRIALESCKKELEQLARELEPPSWAGKEASKRRALIIAAGWPLKEKDTRKALENLGHLKATLNLAIATDQMLYIQIKGADGY
jgi:hypothetical protein